MEMKSLFTVAVSCSRILFLVDFVTAGMSEAMMQESARKIDFWNNLDYASIKSHRSASANVTCSGGSAGGFACSNVDLKSYMTLESIGCGAWNNEQVTAGYANDIWGYTSPDGVEIAIVGCSTGTSFVDIRDPITPSLIGFMPRTTAASYWSDIKVIGDYAYVGSESSGSGLQILSLATVTSDATSGLTGQSYSPTSVYSGISSAHNLEANEDSGYLYVLGASGGSDSCGGGVLVLDVFVNPVNPEVVTCFSGASYVHDAHCVMYHGPDVGYQGREICMTFSEDKIVMLDVTSKCDIQIISVSTYPDTSYTHQGWFSEDHSYFSMGDEMDELNRGVNTRTLFWDASELSSPALMRDHRAATTSIDHNMYCANGYIFQSNYCGGLRVLNGSIPVPMSAGDDIQEVGYFEVSSSCSGSGAPWLGSWSNYPFFPSGNVAVASIEMGLFVLRPQFYGTGPVSVAPAPPSITRTECVPTSAPTVTSTPLPSLSPTASTTFPACITVTISLTDSFGDGWNDNYLYLDTPENMGTTTQKVTLPSGSSATKYLCLPPGEYSPFACGGSWDMEVWWSVEGVSGRADDSCSPTSGSFTLLPSGATMSPSLSPTPVPSVHPTSAPSSCPSDNEVTVQLTDSYGDGWNGNYLFFSDPSAMTSTLMKLTLTSGHGNTQSLCLPDGTYSPFACGGNWDYEVQWSVVGRGVSGGADNTCSPTSGSFVVGGVENCCCDGKMDEVMANQASLFSALTSTDSASVTTALSTDHTDSSESSSTTSTASTIDVSVVTLVVGVFVFVGMFSGTAAVAVLSRERYVMLHDAVSGGGAAPSYQ